VLDGETPEHGEEERSDKTKKNGGDPHATAGGIAGAHRAGTMTLQQLETFCYELLATDGGTNTLTAFTDEELKMAYLDVLQQYGLELVCGAYENSTWMGGTLMIAGNEGPIKACATAFLAVLVEMSKRNIPLPA